MHRLFKKILHLQPLFRNVRKRSLCCAVLEEAQGQNLAWKEALSNTKVVVVSLAAVSCFWLESEIKQSSCFGSVESCVLLWWVSWARLLRSIYMPRDLDKHLAGFSKASRSLIPPGFLEGIWGVYARVCAYRRCWLILFFWSKSIFNLIGISIPSQSAEPLRYFTNTVLLVSSFPIIFCSVLVFPPLLVVVRQRGNLLILLPSDLHGNGYPVTQISRFNGMMLWCEIMFIAKTSILQIPP